MADGPDLQHENAALRARVAELEARLARAEHLADTDTLTPLANRRFFYRAIERSVAQLGRHGTPASLVFLDVDGLKALNDTHGHAVGDEALIHIAWVLQENIRTGDVVARLAGDEFGVLLDYTEEGAALEKARSLCEAVEERPLKNLALSVSAGVTALRAADTPEAALARADAAMYLEKHQQS
jgi:diguanylate cyclase (GGDEF)-like protein